MTTVVKSDTRMRSPFATGAAPAPLMVTVTVCASEALPSVACTV